MGVLTPEEMARLDTVPGWFSPTECKRMVELAAQVPADLAIVELGSHKGRSTAFAAAASKRGFGARIYAVDLWADGIMPTPGECFDEFDVNLRRLGLREMVDPIRGLTNFVGQGWNRPIGLLHIDASHDYESCAADYRIWARHVVPGGWMAIHDYRNPSWPDVERVIEEIIRPSGLWVDEVVADTLYTARRAG